MLNREDELLPVFRDHAEKGDGQFAIAYAILRLTGEHRKLQENLTFGNGSPRVQGVLERLAMGVDDIAKAIDTMSQSDD